jgi:hypothetical protein
MVSSKGEMPVPLMMTSRSQLAFIRSPKHLAFSGRDAPPEPSAVVR